MIPDEFAWGLQVSLLPQAQRVFNDTVSQFASSFERSDADRRNLVFDGLQDSESDVAGLAALLAIIAFGDVDSAEFLRDCDAILPDRSDRLAVLTLADPITVGIVLATLDPEVYAPADLCRRLEGLITDGAPTARGWAAVALGFLADDVERARDILVDLVVADPSRFVVAAAMFGLAVLGADDLNSTLRTVALTDPDARVRGAAYRLLGLRGVDGGAAFADVDAIAVTGAMTGRAIVGEALSDEELRRVRARLRRRPVDEGAGALVLALVPQAGDVAADLLAELIEVVEHLPASQVGELRVIVDALADHVDSAALRRVATALAERERQATDAHE